MRCGQVYFVSLWGISSTVSPKLVPEMTLCVIQNGSVLGICTMENLVPSQLCWNDWKDLELSTMASTLKM